MSPLNRDSWIGLIDTTNTGKQNEIKSNVNKQDLENFVKNTITQEVDGRVIGGINLSIYDLQEGKYIDSVIKEVQSKKAIWDTVVNKADLSYVNDVLDNFTATISQSASSTHLITLPIINDPIEISVTEQTESGLISIFNKQSYIYVPFNVALCTVAATIGIKSFNETQEVDASLMVTLPNNEYFIGDTISTTNTTEYAINNITITIQADEFNNGKWNFDIISDMSNQVHRSILIGRLYCIFKVELI